MTDRKPNEAGLRANDPVDRLDLPPEAVGEDPQTDPSPAPTPSRPRSEGAEMAPEIDEVDGEEA
jgi:hypothetical protein